MDKCNIVTPKIFKCLEETVLKKVFIIELDDSSIISYGAKSEKIGGAITVIPFEKTEYIHTNLKASVHIIVGEACFNANDGLNFYKV